jgi:lysophospholipase L1-like esterase
MRRYNIWIKVLVLTNSVSLIFLIIVSLYYKVPQKVLNKLGIIKLTVSRTVSKSYPGYNINNIISLTYEYNSFDIVMAGDSLTNRGNWNELLHKRGIANLGIDGDSTGDVLKRLDDIYYLNPKTCFIMVGINDFLKERSVEYVIQNYRKIIQEMKQHNIRIIVQSVLHLGHNYYINHIGGKDKRDWGIINEKVEKLNIELEKMAEEYEVEYADINIVLSKNNILAEEYGDYGGLHLSELGYEKWVEIIKTLIE